MDFLDPRKTRKNNFRLMFGYVLVAIAIGLGTVILVYGTYGYGVNTKTGDIVQNGLLFVDSKPGGSEIILNGKGINSNTSARLVLPSGDYNLMLKKDGYKSWERKFTLEEHSIERFVYPFLFPENPATKNLKTYTTTPSLITQSPDRQWLLVLAPGYTSKSIIFDEYDTSDLAKSKKSLTLPANLSSNFSPSSKFTEVEWSTDNKNLLLKHTYSSGYEFLIFDRDNPAKSINLSGLFNTVPSEVNLRNKKIDQLYFFNKKEKTLRIANVNSGRLESVLLKNVLAYKTFGINIVTYVTTNENSKKNEVETRVWNNGRSYPLRTFSAGTKYLIDGAQFQGHYYYFAGSNTSDRINIYKDPISDIQNPEIGRALPLYALDILGATNAKFSANTRFISVQNKNSFAVYDIEEEFRYKFNLNGAKLTGNLHWMDGHRLMGNNQGKIFVMDYDSTNQHIISSTLLEDGGFFSRDYNKLITLNSVSVSRATTLTSIDMRAGTDLPKNAD
jgi:hypothetical protein